MNPNTGNNNMTIKWSSRGGRFDDEYLTAKLGHLTLSCSEIDGDNQPYGITIVSRGTAKMPQVIRVAECDAHFGGLRIAKERVEYLAKCFLHGIPHVLTDWEKKHLELKNLDKARGNRSITPMHGVNVGGLYYYEKADAWFTVKMVGNIVGHHKKCIPELAGPTSVVFIDVFTDLVYIRTVEEFLKLGLTQK